MTTTHNTEKQRSSPIEIKARIWRTVEKDAISNRGDAFKQEALKVALQELRRAVDDSKAQP